MLKLIGISFNSVADPGGYRLYFCDFTFGVAQMDRCSNIFTNVSHALHFILLHTHSA